jgi:hypothetical protein
MTNERHLLTKREALLSSPDVRRLGMSFRLMPGARIALTPVKGARETPTGEPVAVSSGNPPAALVSLPTGLVSPPTVLDP